MNKKTLIALLGALALAFAGCSNDSATSDTPRNNTNNGGNQTVDPGGEEPGGEEPGGEEPGGETPQNPDLDGDYYLQVRPGSFSLETGETKELTFTVKDYDNNNQPVSGAKLSVSINKSSCSVSNKSPTTNSSGTATVTFSAGSKAVEGGVITVKLYGNNSNDVLTSETIDFDVALKDDGGGTTVKPEYSIAADPAEFSTEYDAVDPQVVTVTLSATNNGNVSNEEVAVQIKGTQPLKYCSAVESVKTNASGKAEVEFACTYKRGAPEVIEGNLVFVYYGTKKKQVSVPFTVELKPDFEADYEVLLKVNLASLLPDKYQKIFNIVTEVFSDPTGYLVDFLIEKLETAVNNDTVTTILNMVKQFGLMDQLKDMLAGLVEENIPYYEDVQVIGNDVLQMAQAFNVGADFTITPQETVGDETALKVLEKWSYVIWQWKHKVECDSTEPTCGRDAFKLKGSEIVRQEYAAHWTAEEGKYRISYDSATDFPLNYGPLANMLINQVMVPAITQNPEATSLDALIKTWVDCTALSESVITWANEKASELLGTSINLSTSLLVGPCNSGIAAGANYVTTQLNGLNANVGLVIPAGSSFMLSGLGDAPVADSTKNLATFSDLLYSIGRDGTNAEITGAGAIKNGCETDEGCAEGYYCGIPDYNKFLLVDPSTSDPNGTKGLEWQICEE